MRALRVVGLHEDGRSIVCEDTARGERFLLPADERLRAAARGDITRLGQIEIELESQMRPREIQARIRAGESVEQVANSGGIPVARVERFAYPVLLERSRTAEMAQAAHPVREDGPDVQTLGEVVAYAFGVFGQDYTNASWDSWKGEDGKWVVGLNWQTGRSDNRAHWCFAPGAHGGTVTALDENAQALMDPNAYRSLRAVDALGRPSAPAPVEDQPMLDAEEETVVEAPVAEVPEEAPAAATADGGLALPGVEEQVEAAKAAPRPAKKKKGHPAVPAWEDVLLGVRSSRG
ncbi:septation protein SepH [Amycolatopsis albispora]|uniref:DNA-binding protein n=1 Tax=Amycolatopsis albispora TaxID=1804986 RepID=A0A344LL69_9PSEU|nr:septation protein SepH [Amycolatopsis albispora]AXB48793.1 DNA-binding protein [Amycolatopsis albispora]